MQPLLGREFVQSRGTRRRISEPTMHEPKGGSPCLSEGLRINSRMEVRGGISASRENQILYILNLGCPLGGDRVWGYIDNEVSPNLSRKESRGHQQHNRRRTSMTGRKGSGRDRRDACCGRELGGRAELASHYSKRPLARFANNSVSLR